jgi:hypothetical protein
MPPLSEIGIGVDERDAVLDQRLLTRGALSEESGDADRLAGCGIGDTEDRRARGEMSVPLAIVVARGSGFEDREKFRDRSVRSRRTISSRQLLPSSSSNDRA